MVGVDIATEISDGTPALPLATYESAVLIDHQANPLLEALPSYRLVSEMDGGSLGSQPPKPGPELELSKGQRSLAVGRLRRWLQPLASHEVVIDLIGNMVRDGYVGRNPLDPKEKRRKVLFSRGVEAKEGVLRHGVQGSAAPSMALFGISGLGKTIVVDHALDQLFPKVLYHDKHRFIQIVWLKFEFPSTGSFKQLLAEIVESIEDLAQANERASARQLSPEQLVVFVARLVTKYNLGLFVLDQIENLLQASDRERRETINFLVSLSNAAGIPVMTIGTPLAFEQMDKQRASLRKATTQRIGDMGAILWDRMPQDMEWLTFLEAMFEYQWTKTHARISPNMVKVLHSESAGIPALVVRLFQFAQMRAISDGTEEVTARLIEEVALERFAPLRPMLDALASGKDASRWENQFRDQMSRLDSTLAINPRSRGSSDGTPQVETNRGQSSRQFRISDSEAGEGSASTTIRAIAEGAERTMEDTTNKTCPILDAEVSSATVEAWPSTAITDACSALQAGEAAESSSTAKLGDT